MNIYGSLLIMIFSSFISCVLLCCCYKYCKDNCKYKKSASLIVERKFISRNIIKPITNEELDGEPEIRMPQITGDENV